MCDLILRSYPKQKDEAMFGWVTRTEGVTIVWLTQIAPQI